MSEQQFHIPNLTIQFFPQTQEGQAIIATQEVFCLGGDLYQGYKGAICSVHERTLLDEEMDAVRDVDGTLARVKSSRANRLGSRQHRKEKEYKERDEEKRRQRLADLDLAMKERELGLRPTENPVLQQLDAPEELPAEEPVEPVEAAPPEPVREEMPALPREAPERVTCAKCGAMSPERHRNPENWLRGHNMGKHKKKG